MSITDTDKLIDEWVISANYDAQVECDYCQHVLINSPGFFNREELRLAITGHYQSCRKFNWRKRLADIKSARDTC